MPPLIVTGDRDRRHTLGNEELQHAAWSRCGSLWLRFRTACIDPAARQQGQAPDRAVLLWLYVFVAPVAEHTRLRLVIFRGSENCPGETCAEVAGREHDDDQIGSD